jgi:hypothetical protein
MIIAVLALALAHQPRVVDIFSDPIRVYDQNGVPAGTRSKSSFTPLPLRVEGINKRQQVGVEIGGAVIYLKRADIQTEDLTAVPCTYAQTPTPASGSSMAASAVGAGAGLSTNSLKCVSGK